MLESGMQDPRRTRRVLLHSDFHRQSPPSALPLLRHLLAHDVREFRSHQTLVADLAHSMGRLRRSPCCRRRPPFSAVSQRLRQV